MKSGFQNQEIKKLKMADPNTICKFNQSGYCMYQTSKENIEKEIKELKDEIEKLQKKIT